jgi:pseudouridine-5'-phosphate glycosidase/pseudouridine kinase
MVIGSMAVDITCTVPSLNRTSLPLDTATSSKMYATAGGVAHNVALAATYASPSSVQLLTAVGADPEGAWLAHYAQRAELDVKLISGTGETARNIKINDKAGQVILSTADMGIIQTFEQPDLQSELRYSEPKCIVFDGYISPESVQTILEGCNSTTKRKSYSCHEINLKVLFEPTSEERAMTIFEKPVELGIFPNHSLNMTTPNVYELRAMFKAAQKNGNFENNEWRSLLDSFMLTSQFRQGTLSLNPSDCRCGICIAQGESSAPPGLPRGPCWI